MTDTEYGLKALADECRRVMGTQQGGRNGALNTAAFRMGQIVAAGHLAEETARVNLTGAGMATLLGHVEVRNTVQSGLMSGMSTARDIPDRHANAIWRETAPAGDGPPQPEWVDLAALMRDGVPGGGWILEPLIGVGRQTLLYAPQKTGKSLLALEIAWHVAAGKPVLGQQDVEQRHVAYFDFENSLEDVHDRIEDMGLDVAFTAGHLHYASFPTIGALDTPGGGDTLLRWAQSVNADLVVIDTASRTISGEENSNDTWNNWYRHTGMKLKAAGIALLRLDHPGKDVERGPRGGSAKMADVDAIWSLECADREKQIFHLVCRDSRVQIHDDKIVIKRLNDPVTRHKVEGAGLAASFQIRLGATVERLDAMDVPPDHGYRKARAKLKEAGYKSSDNIVRAAQETRRERTASGQCGRR